MLSYGNKVHWIPAFAGMTVVLNPKSIISVKTRIALSDQVSVPAPVTPAEDNNREGC